MARKPNPRLSMATVASEAGPAAGTAALAEAAPPEHSVGYVKQDQDQWCWAACFEMIRGWMNLPPMSQLEMATNCFGPAACANPASATCNQSAFPDEVADKCGLRCLPRERRLNAAELAQELRYGPVEAFFFFPPGSIFRRHVALITGVGSDGAVRLLDPWPEFGPSYRTLQELQTDYHGGTWERSYVQFGRA
jgi:hypothetical protein